MMLMVFVHAENEEANYKSSLPRVVTSQGIDQVVETAKCCS